ncbi:DUF1214 domain-containing protein [Microvirga alba]|uniref:DUF1214 domain-containing protein n=1 Tax=Microvirga alba TaxID=2791025 RepID=A0A931FQR5_9HYPH|nr:DUF1214 domain-containing protein [Microvirga alba]MBF9232041.1 DUF1214 domain-containing protein [Microvirga alba]
MRKTPALHSTRIVRKRSSAGRPRSFPTAILVVYALLLALGLGLGSAYLVLKGDPPFGTQRIGPWRAWPKLGSTAADPYMRAIVARRGEIPLGIGEGLALSARMDSEGRKLDAACTYRIGSVMPVARFWTLTLYDKGGRLPVSDLGRNGFTSTEIIRSPDNAFSINLSRDLQPGNWLQLPPAGYFSVVLRLYDVPGGSSSSVDVRAFPTIDRLGCAS